MLAHNVAADRQTEPVAEHGGCAGAFRTIVPFKNVRDFLWGETHAGVADTKHHGIRTLEGLNLHSTALAVVLDGIAEQVVYDLA